MYFKNKTLHPNACCTACNGSSLKLIGALPDFREDLFCGYATNTNIKSGVLLHCLNCDLYFRYPCLPQNVLTELYEELPDDIWTVTKPKYY